jgi:hypothetical protein
MFVSVHSMKAYSCMAVNLDTFITSALLKRTVDSFRPMPLYTHRKKNPVPTEQKAL